jgi:hypothetical protein
MLRGAVHALDASHSTEQSTPFEHNHGKQSGFEPSNLRKKERIEMEVGLWSMKSPSFSIL